MHLKEFTLISPVIESAEVLTGLPPAIGSISKLQKHYELRKMGIAAELSKQTMTPEEQQALHYHAQELAKILHKHAPKEALTNLEGIEKTVRGQILEHVSPEIALFLSNKLQAQIEAGNGG